MIQRTNELKPMGVGDVLDYSIEIFKSNFKTFALLTLMLYLPWVFIQSLISSSLFGNTFQIFEVAFKSIFDGDYAGYMNEIESIASDRVTLNVLSNLMSFLSMCYGITIKLVYNACIMKIVYDYVVNKQKVFFSFKNVKNKIKEGFGFMPRMMGNAFFFNLIFWGAYYVSFFVAFILIVIMLIFFSGYLEKVLPTNVLIAFGIILSIVLLLAALFCTVFFWIKLIFGANAIVSEDASVFGSIKRSWKLSKGYFWHIALTCLFGFLLFFVSGNMLTAASLAVSYISKALFVLLYTVTSIFNAFLHPFTLIFITLVFINIKIQKEGLDLQIKINSIIQNQLAVNNSVGGGNIND
jgi:hypothetical protein